MSPGRPRHIEVIPLGPVDQVAVSVVAANVQTFIGLPVNVMPAWPEPDYALLRPRMQYHAARILNELSTGLPDHGPRRLGVMSGDLCLPIFSHVFGEAQMGGLAAVLSLFRLRLGTDGRPVPSAVLYERLAKVAVHETAHVLGLKHCRDPRCVMAFSLGLEQLDALTPRFCPDCRLAFRSRAYGALPF